MCSSVLVCRAGNTRRAFAVGRVTGGVRGKKQWYWGNGPGGAALMRHAAAIAQRPGVTESDRILEPP